MGKYVLTNYIDIKKEGLQLDFASCAPAATIFFNIYEKIITNLFSYSDQV